MRRLSQNKVIVALNTTIIMGIFLKIDISTALCYTVFVDAAWKAVVTVGENPFPSNRRLKSLSTGDTPHQRFSE